MHALSIDNKRDIPYGTNRTIFGRVEKTDFQTKRVLLPELNSERVRIFCEHFSTKPNAFSVRIKYRNSCRWHSEIIYTRPPTSSVT